MMLFGERKPENISQNLSHFSVTVQKIMELPDSPKLSAKPWNQLTQDEKHAWREAAEAKGPALFGGASIDNVEQFSEKQSKGYCIRGTNRYSTHVATKKFSERLTRVVRQDEEYDDDRLRRNHDRN